MRQHLPLLVALSFSLAPSVKAAPVPSPIPSKWDGSIFVEAERFQYPGGWWPRPDGGTSGTEMLAVHQDDKSHQGKAQPNPRPASALIPIAKASRYFLWIRMAALGKQPARLEVKINGESAVVDSTSPKYTWQRVSSYDLEAGDAIIQFADLGGKSAECDAILLTPFDRNPNDFPLELFQRYKVTLPPAKTDSPLWFPDGAAVAISADAAPKATLQSDRLRVEFFEIGAGDQQRVRRRISLNSGGSWQKVFESDGAEMLFLLRAEDGTPKFRPHPTWEQAHPEPLELTAGGQQTAVWPQADNPFTAGRISAFVPVKVESAAGIVTMTWRSPDGGEAVMTWRLSTDRTLDVSVERTISEDGWYSWGFAAFREFRREEVGFLMMPPMVSELRIPDRPWLCRSSIMPVPYVQAEVRAGEAGDEKLNFILAADPHALPYRWPSSLNAVYGFCTLNPRGGVQPVIFSPVLGLDGSQRKAGDVLKASWRMAVIPGPWTEGFDYAVKHIFEQKDYRQPLETSLTGAILNMIDLMKDADAAGWDAENGGFWDIETPHMAKHAAPLAIVSAALISRDEELFASKALPTIAFSLSRKLAWQVPGEKGADDLAVPSDFWSASYWAGLDDLMGGLNPWMKEFFSKKDALRHSKMFNTSPPWTEKLALYRHDPTLFPLEEIKSEARQFIDERMKVRATEERGFYPFYHHANYPYWYDLLDLYDITGDRDFLSAAEEGAHYSMSGQWVHPLHLEGKITIQANGLVRRPPANWFKGGREYRLGITENPVAVKEEEVEAWKVSPEGLTLETPTTLFQDPDVFALITTVSWAGSLLRLDRHTHNDLYRTFARNAIIGRFGNYPGYYHADFSTLWHDPKFPLTGPDVSNIYFHHIPVHYALSMDYLVADVESRSSGQVTFPYARQKNYLWFTNRIYGLQPGRVFDCDGMRLWLKRGIVDPDTSRVDWLAARNANTAAIFFLNQTPAPVAFKPKVNLAMFGSAARLHRDAETEALPVTLTEQTELTIPPGGMVTLILPSPGLPADLPMPAAPLDRGHWQQPLPEPWRGADVFRIRTPFGSDCVFALINNLPGDHGSVSFRLAAGSERTDTDGVYPYDAIFFPLGISDAARVGAVAGKKEVFNLALPKPAP